MSAELDGKVVLVAGASSGMGMATARRAGQQGASVALMARRKESLEALASELGDAGADILVCAADAQDLPAVEQAIAAVLHRFGRLDAVINTIGTNIKQRALEDLTPENWEMMLSVNLTAGFNLTKSVLPAFRGQKDGLIVHVSSSAAKKPDMAGAAYHAGKAGIVGLAHATMEEERANGIRTSVVFPGLTDTPLVEQRPTPVPPDMLAKAMQPEDVAQMCLALVALPARAYVPELLLYPSQL